MHHTSLSSSSPQTSLLSEIYPRHCYVIIISIELKFCIGCQCHVASRYRLILAIAPHCFAVDILSPFHWSPTNVQYLFIIVTKGMSIQWTKNQHRRYSQTNTFITVCVYAAAGDTFTSFPEVRWRKYDVRVTWQQCCRWSIVCFFLSVQTSI